MEDKSRLMPTLASGRGVFGASRLSVPVCSPHSGGSCAAPSTERPLWSPGSSVLEAAFASRALTDPIALVCVDSRRAPAGFGLGPGAPWALLLTPLPWQARGPRCDCWAAAETLRPRACCGRSLAPSLGSVLSSLSPDLCSLVL